MNRSNRYLRMDVSTTRVWMHRERDRGVRGTRPRPEGFLPLLRKLRMALYNNVKEQLQSPHRIEIHARGLPTTIRDSFLKNMSSHAPVSSEVIRLTDRRAVRTSASGGAAAVDARAHASPADARAATITSGSRE